MKVAYLANSFPEAVESYVWEEIAELRTHSIEVLPCSIRRPSSAPKCAEEFTSQTLYLFPLNFKSALETCWVLAANLFLIRDLLGRILRGHETWSRKLRTVAHTWLGAYFAVRVRHLRPSHIHVHHGFFAAWVGMVAARILRASFSMTLHGSDLLVRGDYLDIKLSECKFCFTISEFNRRYILDHYGAAPSKVVIRRLGIDPSVWSDKTKSSQRDELCIVSVGRLHAVKNHAFLLLACRALERSDLRFRCLIAGEGDERHNLEQLIRALGLEDRVTLLGHVSRHELPQLYAQSDAVVLTSKSEGIPVALMEAMATGAVVLAPEITGIPELVVPGKTGFLYRPNSMEDFLVRLKVLLHGRRLLSSIRRSARQHVEENFNGPSNLARFADQFLTRVKNVPGSGLHQPHEDPVLQQI